jgi:hypothetical protein
MQASKMPAYYCARLQSISPFENVLLGGDQFERDPMQSLTDLKLKVSLCQLRFERDQ